MDAIFEDSNFDPFSNDPLQRNEWLNKLVIPKILFNKEETKLGKEIGRGEHGKVFELTFNGQKYAVKIIRNNKAEETIQREFPGLLLANKLFPNNFPKPIGELLNDAGKPVGLVMELVTNKKQFSDFFDQDEYKLSGKIIPIKGKQPPDSFFNKLRQIIIGLGKNNLWLNDININKILVDEEWNPSIIDVQFYTRAMRDWDVNDAITTIDKIQALFNNQIN